MTTRALVPEPQTTLRVPAGIALLFGGLIANLLFGASTIVLPSVSADLGLSPGAAGLVVAVFSLGFAASLVAGGRLGDRYGRRRLWRCGLVGIAVSSVVVAVASDGPTLVVARLVEGIAAGAMLPQVLSTIQHSTDGVPRARWLAGYAAVLGCGTTVGQLAAGLLCTVLPGGWRWTFVLVGGLSAVAATVGGRVPETRSARVGRIDGSGALLFGGGIGALLLPLTLGPGMRWPWWTFALVGVAAAALAGFALWERRIDQGRALLPSDVLRQPALRTGIALTMVFFAAYTSFVYVYSLAAGRSLQLSPLAAAATLLPYAIGFVGLSALGPRVRARLGGTRMMRLGAAGQALMLASVAATVVLQWPDPAQGALQPLLVVMGAAQAMMYGPLIGTVLDAVPTRIAGVASGLFATAQQLAIAMGVAVFGLLHDLAGGGRVAFGVCVLADAALAVAFGIGAGRLRGGASAPM